MQLRDIGWDEIRLHDWLSEDPQRLGLGTVTIQARELGHRGSGSLDILATESDTYFSVEVQLGEVDASHSFRVFDYWARNRQRYPGKTHIAVLIAESAAGRFRLALEALAETVPLIVLELRAIRGGSEVIVVSELVIANETLELDIAPTGGTSERTAEDWREQITEDAWAFHEAFVAWVEDNLGEVRVDYAPASYIGVWRGRRVWGPIWPVRDGGTLHLPDPDGSKDEPSVAFEHFREQLREVGLEPSWQPGYNAGANPIFLRLTRGDLDKPVVQELLRASFEILELGAEPWSERDASATPRGARPAPPSQTNGPHPSTSPVAEPPASG